MLVSCSVGMVDNKIFGTTMEFSFGCPRSKNEQRIMTKSKLVGLLFSILLNWVYQIKTLSSSLSNSLEV